MSNTNKRVFTDESLSTLVDNIKSGDEETLSSAKEYSDSIKIDLENAVEIISTKLDTIEDGAQVNTVASVAGKTGEVTLSKTDVGLENVDNTSDAIKKANFTGQISESNTGFVTGGDVYIQLTNKVDKVTGKGLSTNDLTDSLKSNYDIAYTNNHTHDNKTVLDNISATTVNTWNNKQDALTFDSAPTSGSTNPVTSEGVKTALDNIKECEVININITEDEIANNTTGRIIRTLSTTDGVIIFDETKECVIIVNVIGNILMFHRQQVIIESDGTANALFIAQDIDCIRLLGVTKADNEYSVIIDFEGTTYGFSYVDLLSKGGETKYELNSNDGNRHIQFREGANISLTSQGTNQVIISATDTTYENATTTKSGLMSASDKEKLDFIEYGAQMNQNAFSTAAILNSSGTLKSTIESDVSTSNLAFQEGQNITLTGTEGDDKIQIAFSGTLPIANGGTGATTQSAAITNLVNGTGVVNSQSITNSDYVVFQSNGSDVLRMSVADFKTALGISAPYTRMLLSGLGIETATSTDTFINSLAKYGTYCHKITAEEHGKGTLPTVHVNEWVLDSPQYYIEVSVNIITDSITGDVYIFTNLDSDYYVIIR